MEKVEANRNFANKLWNAGRYLLGNLKGLSPPELQSLAVTSETKLTQQEIEGTSHPPTHPTPFLPVTQTSSLPPPTHQHQASLFLSGTSFLWCTSWWIKSPTAWKTTTWYSLHPPTHPPTHPPHVLKEAHRNRILPHLLIIKYTSTHSNRFFLSHPPTHSKQGDAGQLVYQFLWDEYAD